MASRLTLKEYNKRLSSIYAGKITARSFVDVQTSVTHVCSDHGKFQSLPKTLLYRKRGCPKCYESRREQGNPNLKAALDPQRRNNIKVILREIKRKKVLRVEQKTSWLLDNTICTTKITYTCLSCGSTKNPCNLSQAKNNSNGCRKCTNRSTNSQKIIARVTLLEQLRAQYPDINILDLTTNSRSNPVATAGSKVVFECPRCETEVTRSRFPFSRPGALRLCKACTDEHVVRTGKHTAFQKTRVRERTTGKIFEVQGYELAALKLLKAQGLSMKHLKPSQEADVVSYEFEGKQRNYFPDLQYKKMIIEVKSLHTAGLKTSMGASNYRGFRMLKAKAIACLTQGYTFRLMLLVDSGKGKPLVEAELPEDWMFLKAATLKQRLGLKK